MNISFEYKIVHFVKELTSVKMLNEDGQEIFFTCSFSLH